MGVDLFILNRRQTTLIIGGKKVRAGVAKKICKLTEIDDTLAANIQTATAALEAMKKPKIVIVDRIYCFPASASEQYREGHPVLAWHPKAAQVTDLNWDMMPVLGYAEKDNTTGTYVVMN